MRVRCPVDDTIFESFSTNAMPHHTGHPDCPQCQKERPEIVKALAENNPDYAPRALATQVTSVAQEVPASVLAILQALSAKIDALAAGKPAPAPVVASLDDLLKAGSAHPSF